MESTPKTETPKRKGCFLVVLIASLSLLAVIGDILLFGPKSIDIGKSTNPMHFRTMADLNKDPQFNFSLFGRKITYPAWVPKIDKAKLSPETAGVIFIEVVDANEEDKGGVRWRIDGKEVYVDPLGINAPVVFPGWDYAAVPFARAANKRDAEVWNLKEWVRVKLPYEASQVPGPMPTIKATAGPYTLEAKPQPRVTRATTAAYVLACPSPSKDLYIEGAFEVTGSSAGSYSNPFGTTIDPKRLGGEEWPVLVGRHGETRLTGRIHEVERVKIPITATDDPTYQITVKTIDGKVLMQNGELQFKKLGYIAIEFGDILVHHKDQTGSQPVAYMSPREITAFRSIRSYPFSIKLTNDLP